MLVVFVVSVDAYPFLAFSDLTCHLKHAYGIVSLPISGGVDISKICGFNLFRQMSSQWGSQKLLQGLMSLELTVFLSVLDHFLTE